MASERQCTQEWVLCWLLSGSISVRMRARSMIGYLCIFTPLLSSHSVSLCLVNIRPDVVDLFTLQCLWPVFQDVSIPKHLSSTKPCLTGLSRTVLEERANYRKESANGLYSALPFVLANSVVTLPFLFVCSTLFVLIMYWGIVTNEFKLWSMFVAIP